MNEAELHCIEDSIVLDFTCLECKNHLIKPIYHCERGHSICFNCFKDGDLCKYCGSSRNGTRTYHLERIFNVLTFPCKYFGNGCQKRLRLDKLKQHEEECQTFKMSCPMREHYNCAFIGTKPQIVFHCQINHGSLTFVGGKCFKQRILHKNFEDEISAMPDRKITKLTVLYCYNDTLFQGNLQLDSQHISMNMVQLGPPTEKDFAYTYVIKFLSFDDKIVRVFNQKCQFSKGNSKENSGLLISTDLLTKCRYFLIEFCELF